MLSKERAVEDGLVLDSLAHAQQKLQVRLRSSIREDVYAGNDKQDVMKEAS